MRPTAPLHFLLSAAIRMIPRRHRFGLVHRIARGAAPLLRRSSASRLRQGYAVNGETDVLLHLFMRSLDRHRVEIDFAVSFESLVVLDRARASGRGVLLIGAHTLLSTFAVRRLHEMGYELAVVADRARASLRPGRSGVVRRIVLSPTFLFEVRSALLDRGLVYAQIDRGAPVPGLTEPVETGAGTAHISDALIRLAVRCNARIVFLASRAGESGVACTIAAPEPEASRTPEDVTRAFVEFLQAHVRRASRASVAGPATDPRSP